MKIEPFRFVAEDGRACVIRSARPSDSGRVLDHVWEIHTKEPEVNVPDADEIQLSASRLRGLLRGVGGSDNSLFLLAEVDGLVVATVSLRGGRHRKVRHSARLGLSVRRGWRRQGIGRALMQRARQTAVRGGVLRRITLEVFSGNTAALRLYESLGYTVEGRRRGAIRIGDRYEDEILMALELVEDP